MCVYVCMCIYILYGGDILHLCHLEKNYVGEGGWLAHHFPSDKQCVKLCYAPKEKRLEKRKKERKKEKEERKGRKKRKKEKGKKPRHDLVHLSKF